jgi:hypothetical protein
MSEQIVTRNSFADRPDGIAREDRQNRIRAVLLTYCEPKLKYDGMSAWEVAGKILAVLEPLNIEDVPLV